MEILIAYFICIGLLFLNRATPFPFFELLCIGVICASIQPIQVSNVFVLLSVPMAIANYNLKVWVLTYPEIILCYFSTYIFSQGKTNWRNLLWIINVCLYAGFGLGVMPAIGRAL